MPGSSFSALGVQPDISLCTSPNKHIGALGKLLTRIQEARDTMAIEIILVDTSDQAASYHKEYPHITLFEDPAETNQIRALNRALSLAKGRYMALCDHDIVPQPDCFNTLLTYLDQEPAVGLAAPRILDAHGGKEPNVADLPGFCSVIKTHSGINTISECAGLIGGMLVLRRETYEELGAFDYHLDKNYAALDYAWRARQAGWHISHVPQAAVVHPHPSRYHPDLDRSLSTWKQVVSHLRFFLRRWCKKKSFFQEPGFS